MREMKSPQFNKHPVDAYFHLLENLSSDQKQELISRLSISMKSKSPEPESLRSLFGAFIFDQSPEDLVKEIRESRTFNQNRAGL